MLGALDSGSRWDTGGIVGFCGAEAGFDHFVAVPEGARTGEIMLLAEDLMLLVLDGETGWTMVTDVSTGLAGAVLIELADLGQVDVDSADDGRVVLLPAPLERHDIPLACLTMATGPDAGSREADDDWPGPDCGGGDDYAGETERDEQGQFDHGVPAVGAHGFPDGEGQTPAGWVAGPGPRWSLGGFHGLACSAC